MAKKKNPRDATAGTVSRARKASEERLVNKINRLFLSLDARLAAISERIDKLEEKVENITLANLRTR